ncbi:hypothetical protein ACJMK2_024210 [Sinanodonta woodiana]|uniref:Polypeptide N-acetylgalactosaminyltransferase n=1 Tax=Sinanodonta woodiana TaxID=1069815 RepID=A0ABD3T6N9_SINWO
MVFPRSVRRLLFRLLWIVPLVCFAYIIFSAINTHPDVHNNQPKSFDENSQRKLPLEPPDSKNLVFQNHEDKLDVPVKVVPVEAEKNIVPFQKDNDNQILKDAMENGERKETAIKYGADEKYETEMKAEDKVKAALMAPVHPDKPLIDPNAPGEMGKPVIIDVNKLSPEERKKYDEGMMKNAFNQYASDMISLHRSLPDIRDPECKQIEYLKDLPDTSVIIIFHNEAWSVLLRTVHSVLDRSPTQLLKEIILVDDFSDFDHLKQPLDEYVARLPKVSLVRLKERSGLIRARIAGFDVSTGEVAIFLDSHCEATEGWLEPLLDRIGRNYTNVVVPVIDVISDENFQIQYSAAKHVQAGGFEWNLIFNWHYVPENERKRRNYLDYTPFRTPTMAGGLFAISRKFFEKLGKYDPGFDIWGGENLELSFKTWMCGGTLETVPCSHVGHIFRKRSPYKWRGGVNVVKRNTVRLAEVWLDEFKEYYYDRISHNLGDYGDVSDRKALRDNLQCKSFRWYLNNVYPELFIPSDSMASGEIRNKAKPMCADGNVEANQLNKPLISYPCHNDGGNQYWLLSTENEIRRDSGCWDYVGGSAEIKLFGCHGQRGNQEWIYRDDETIYHPGSRRCVELSWDGKNIMMKECSNHVLQKWLWKRVSAKGPRRNE